MPPPPTLGCDLLQREVIEVLLGDGALDTERTVTLLASLQPVGHNIYKLLLPSPFPFFPLPFHFSFLFLPCPLNSTKMHSLFSPPLLFSLLFLILCSLVSWSPGLLPQPGVVILLLWREEHFNCFTRVTAI